MFKSLIILLVGFVCLIKGADILVEGSSSLARRFKIPPMVIGLTVVAMGTSLPELSVSFTSALAGQSDMSIANAIGSNIFNVLVILGVCSSFFKLNFEKETLGDLIILILATVSLLLLSYLGNSLVLVDGLLLLLLFGLFLYRTIKHAKGEDSSIPPLPLFKTLVFLVLGAMAIIWGGTLVVDSASVIARILGMSENLIGLTVVAMGTSLPELVTSVVATRKGELDIAVGNVVGSNIFNILFVLGLSSLFNALTISTVTLIDVTFSLLVTLCLTFIAKKYNCLNKKEGLSLVLLYVVYIIYTIIR